MNTKKLLLSGTLFIVLIISVLTVTAIDVDSIEESASDENVSIENGKLNISGIVLNIPEGYKSNGSGEVLDFEGSLGTFEGKGSITRCSFVKDNNTITVSILLEDGNEEYKDDYLNGENKTIGTVNGSLMSDSTDGVNFTYYKDGKIIEIHAPDEQTVKSMLE